MFSLAYVILPVSCGSPAEAIRTSLARFQRGGRGKLPEDWLVFHDVTDELRQDHKTRFTFTDLGNKGMRVEGDTWHLDTPKIRYEMKRLGMPRWIVRFADEMDFATFVGRFGGNMERDATTGGYGRWLNPLGQWDWWDLGGRFDGRIVGERQIRKGRPVADVSSGPNPGRAVLANVENALADALGEAPTPLLDVHNDMNVEMVATLLNDAREGRANAYPTTLVMPPGSAEDSLRWLNTWPRMEPQDAFAWLGLAADATWEQIVQAAYAQFEDHWAAGVAYHH